MTPLESGSDAWLSWAGGDDLAGTESSALALLSAEDRVRLDDTMSAVARERLLWGRMLLRQRSGTCHKRRGHRGVDESIARAVKVGVDLAPPLRDWTALHRHGVVNTADFQGHVSRYAPAPLDALFDAWLFSAALPPFPAAGRARR